MVTKSPGEIGIIRVDLGCGKGKQSGFIGIDRFPLPGVDIVADIDRGIPLCDDSVDYLLASHSLEHVSDLISTMQEVYRVCKDRSVVCIVAPYYQTTLNMANPYHRHVFNEHTPRFFSISPGTTLERKDWVFPTATTWGLAATDYREVKMDFRCLRIEYFYLPEYRALNEAKKRKLRQTKINVVYQIMYHLLVIKEDITDEEIHQYSQGQLEEPIYINVIREQERRDQEKRTFRWRALMAYSRMVDNLFPSRTLRRRYYNLGMAPIRIVMKAVHSLMDC